MNERRVHNRRNAILVVYLVFACLGRWIFNALHFNLAPQLFCLGEVPRFSSDHLCKPWGTYAERCICRSCVFVSSVIPDDPWLTYTLVFNQDG